MNGQKGEKIINVDKNFFNIMKILVDAIGKKQKLTSIHIHSRGDVYIIQVPIHKIRFCSIITSIPKKKILIEFYNEQKYKPIFIYYDENYEEKKDKQILEPKQIPEPERIQPKENIEQNSKKRKLNNEEE